MNEVKKEELKNFLLDNVDILEMLVNELNSLNGSLDHLQFFDNDEETLAMLYATHMDAVQATYYGDYRYMDEFVRLDGYGNLESFDEGAKIRELQFYVDEVIENLIDEYEYVDLPPELETFFDEIETY